MDPFNILSHELWGNVLSNLEDPQDRLNLIWTNSELEIAFQDRKVECGFAAVLPIILRHYGSLQESDQDVEVDAALAECRLVSSLCERTLEKYVKDYWNEDQYQQSMCSFLMPVFSSRREICRFFDKIKDHPYERSPIFCRGVQLDCVFSENPLHSMVDVSVSLMERIGQHFYGLYISCFDFPNLPNLAQYLTSLLQRLPNLRYIKYESVPVDVMQDPVAEPIEPVEPVAAAVLLPALPQLKHLVLAENSGDPLLNEDELTQRHICFMRYFPQLTVLSISVTLWRETYNLAKMDDLFPNLQTLTITEINFLNDEDDADAETPLRKMFKLFKNLDAPPQLKVVCVNIFGALYPSEECEIIDKNASVLEQIGTCLLSKQDPLGKWEGREEHLFESFEQEENITEIYKYHEVKWYNLSRMKVLPPFKIAKPPISTQQDRSQKRKGGMCIIV